MSAVTEGYGSTGPAGRAWEHARTGLRIGAGGMRAISDAFNAALLLATLWATWKLWGKAEYFYAQSGGIPDPRSYGCGIERHGQCMAFVDGVMPTMHLRIYWLTQAWVAGVLAVGFAVLCLGGLRWAYWRVHDYLAV